MRTPDTRSGCKRSVPRGGRAVFSFLPDGNVWLDGTLSNEWRRRCCGGREASGGQRALRPLESLTGPFWAVVL